MKFEFFKSEPPETIKPVTKITVKQVGIQLAVIVKTKGNGWL